MNDSKGIKAVILLVVVVIFTGMVVLSGFSQLPSHLQGEMIQSSSQPSTSLAVYPPYVTSMQSTNPIYAFPGELVNASYYLGSTAPSASYYLVTVTLNSSAFTSLNIVPTLATTVTPSGYYLLFSFKMPNDKPGTWWNVGYQIVPMETETVETTVSASLTAAGNQIWMTYSSETNGGTYEISGGANFSFSSNVTGISIYPSNPPGVLIISGLVNSWTYSSGIIKVNFTLYEYVQSNTKTVPPIMHADVTYNTQSAITIPGAPIQISGPTLQLIQGDGAYIMGITSSQIAEITNSINQTLSIPLSQLNAAVVSINGDVASIETSFGQMTISLKDINASLESVVNGDAQLSTELGQVTTSLSSLNATVASVDYGMVVVRTDLGQLVTSLASINASLSSVRGGIAVMQTDIGTINATLGSINATVLSVEGGVALLNTSLGSISTSLQSLNASIISVSGSTASLMTSVGKINTSLQSINATLLNFGNALQITNHSTAIIETSLGNLSGVITRVSENTTTIQTKLGTIDLSAISSKRADGGDLLGPFSTFQVLIIGITSATLIMSIFAVLKSRRAIEISSKKEG